MGEWFGVWGVVWEFLCVGGCVVCVFEGAL